jgi:hypothetical protein
MPITLDNYKGLQVLPGTPSDGGAAISDNFVKLADRLLHTASADPTASDDSGDGFSVGSRWFNTTKNTEWVCLDATASAAVWRQVVYAIQKIGTGTQIMLKLLGDNAADSFVFQSDYNSHSNFFMYWAGHGPFVTLQSYWGSYIAPQGYGEGGGLAIGTANENTGYGLYVASGAPNGAAFFGAAVIPAVFALTDGATVNTNAVNGNIFTLTLGGNRTLANPTNPANGQKILYRIRQDATGSRTVSWGSAFRFSGGTAPTLTTTANKTDYLTFMYNGADSKWDLISMQLNF